MITLVSSSTRITVGKIQDDENSPGGVSWMFPTTSEHLANLIPLNMVLISYYFKKTKTSKLNGSYASITFRLQIFFSECALQKRVD